MIRKNLKRLFCVLISLILFSLILPAVPARADDDLTIDGFVFDAETLSDSTIGVLFVRGTPSEGGELLYGNFDPAENTWREIPVTNGEDTVTAKEAAFSLSGDIAHIAYTSVDGKIGYLYQTDDGWSDAIFIESNNCNNKTGSLSDPDITIGGDGGIYICYFDTQGAEDEYYARSDAMLASLKDGSFTKSVVINATGWFSSPDGNRTDAYAPIKIAPTSGGATAVVRSSFWEKWYNGNDTAYYANFCKSAGEVSRFDGNYTVFAAAGNGSAVYALVHKSGAYHVISYNGTSNSVMESALAEFGAYAAGLTLDGTNIYYAAAKDSSLLFYLAGEAVSKDSIENPILSSHNKLAAVLSDSIL
ncbi:MAG: hypothetical protein K6F53_10050, partial [Lachnospiraceae bacterium]|nr:hypothetical protein [Lachnospiraceae bacterium]